MIINEKNISETMNLIGYGLAKFDLAFVKEFGFKSKTSFAEYVVNLGLAATIKAVFNRQDSFDPYFDNGRKGWWQRNQREHIKHFIDSLFEKENAHSFANIVKLYISENNRTVSFETEKMTPIIKSKFKQLQETGKEAEFYFMQNYQTITSFENGALEDARLWGDGYDFQIQKEQNFLLAEIKGISANSGNIRITENEFNKANEFKNNYFLVVISNLYGTPKMTVIENPLTKIVFDKKEIVTTQIYYNSQNLKW